MRIETRNLEGRPHLVVPCVMGVAGVWSGSRGPLLYQPDDLADSAAAWNGKPVVVYHPDMTAGGCAGHPDVFSRQRVGTVFNTCYDPGAMALKAEAWLDPDRLAKVDRRVLAAVRAGKMVEVSTGLFTDSEPASGVHNGRAYGAIARNHRPDHLAILPDQEGACSIAMGAGLCRNRHYIGQAPLPLPSMMLVG